MSLNDDAIADLPTDTMVDEDLIKTPPIVPVTDKTTLILTKTPEVKQDVTMVTEEEVQSLLDTDIQFKLIGDQTSKVVELRDIEQEFLAQESIDRHTAQFLNEHFQGLLSPRLTLEEFTRSPSKTNFKVTQQHIQLSISQEEAEVVDTFSHFTTKSLDDVAKVLDRIANDYLSQFMDNMRILAKTSEAVIADVSQNKNTIVPFQNGEHVEFVDVATLDLLALDFNNLKLKTESVASLTAYKDNIRSIIDNSSVKTLIVLVVDCEKVSYPIDKEILMRVSDKPIDLLTLAKFFNGNALRDYLDTFGATVTTAQEDIKKILSEVQELQQTYPAVKEYLITKSAHIHSVINTSVQMAANINNLNILALNVKTLFEYLSNLAKT